MKPAATFTTEAEAYIAKGMLAEYDIESVIGPNHMTTLYGAGATWAPVELYVGEDDYEYARKLLESKDDV